jgi:hypothetical protein
MDHDQSDVTAAQSAIQLGIVPVSPAAARIAALEAQVARLMALTAAKPLAVAEPSIPHSCAWPAASAHWPDLGAPANGPDARISHPPHCRRLHCRRHIWMRL